MVRLNKVWGLIKVHFRKNIYFIHHSISLKIYILIERSPAAQAVRDRAVKLLLNNIS